MEAIKGTLSLVYKNGCILQPNPECEKGVWMSENIHVNVAACV